MNDSLNTLSLRNDRPLEPWRIEVLSIIDAIFREQSCPYMLVGATARDLLLFHVHGGPQPSRRTRDIDFGIAVNTWAAFKGVRDVLLGHDSFHPSKVQHRLLYRTSTVPEAEIDVIPFGELASADGVILWPPEMDRAMSVIGFEEALSAAVLVSISDQLVVPVVSLPGLAVLKLFTWSDRKEDRDATDLYRVIRSYADAGNEERLYDGPLAEELASTWNWQVQNCSGWMLWHCADRNPYKGCSRSLLPKPSKHLLTTCSDARTRRIHQNYD